MKKILIGALLILGITFASGAHAAVQQGYQGGTGISTSTSGNDTKCLTQASSSPFLTWTIGTCGSGGGGVATTTPFTAGFIPFPTSSLSLTNSTIFVSSTGNIGIGTANPLATFSVAGNPFAGITSALTLFGSNLIQAGSNQGTFLGANPSSGFTGDFINFQVNSSTKLLVTSTGTVQLGGNLLDVSGNKYSTSTGGGSVAGADKDVQFNNAGAFGADAQGNFTYTSSTHRLTLGHATSSLFIGSNADFATSSNSITLDFSFTGATSSWTVPGGVNSIVVTAQGAVGGSSTNNGTYLGGKGGIATSTISVSAGTTYYYCIGGMGGTTSGAGAGAAGYCNGAAGGPYSGGGGGMTWFGSAGNFTTSTALVVGGGGGGAAGNINGQTGGTGGGSTGGAGVGGATPAGGGTQIAGGAGGGAGHLGSAGTAGSAGQGGAGAPDATEGGGGGGGGFFGGGGGGSWDNASSPFNGSAGGGSGFASGSGTSTTAGLTNSTGTLRITYTLVTTFSTSSDALFIGGHILTGNQNAATSSVSSCGTGPVVNGNDTAGTVTVGSGVVTSCKVSFGTKFVNTPACALGVFSTTVTGGIVSESTSSLTVGFSTTLGSGQFNYICLDSSD